MELKYGELVRSRSILERGKSRSLHIPLIYFFEDVDTVWIVDQHTCRVTELHFQYQQGVARFKVVAEQKVLDQNYLRNNLIFLSTQKVKHVTQINTCGTDYSSKIIPIKQCRIGIIGVGFNKDGTASH